MPIDGTEQVILGDLSLLTDGATVEVGPGDGGGETVMRPRHQQSAIRAARRGSAGGALPDAGRSRWPPWRRECHHEAKNDYTSVAEPPTVRLVKPQVRTIVRVVGQPSFVQSYERSSVYPKMNAYILNWNVDIGDKVKKGDVLANLFVPELVADHGTKRATVVLDRERICAGQGGGGGGQGRGAGGRGEAGGGPGGASPRSGPRPSAGIPRCNRLEGELKRGVVNPQDVLQTTNRWKASVAARDAAAATVLKAEAELLSRRAALAKAEIDVGVAEAALKVADSEEKRLQAWVDYLVLPAPFDGVIVARNANTFDFVLPNRGDPSACARAPYLSPSGDAAPIYVVDRTDIVRVFVDIPEAGRQLRPDRLEGDGADQGVSRPVDPRHGHAHVMGAEHQEPDAPGRDRPAQSRQPGAAGDVCLRERDHRAPECVDAAGGGAHASWRPDHSARRRKDVLLGVQGRTREAYRAGDRGPGRPRSGERRAVDRGHESPDSEHAGGIDRRPTCPGRRSTDRSR